MSSVGAIFGPILFTQAFAYFTHTPNSIYFPGAAFLLAGVLSLFALSVFGANLRRLLGLRASA